jgi:hypothetical protein
MKAKTRICIYLGIAAVLMVVGHWAVIASGAVFDPRPPARHYDLHTRWVSDFAAKSPEGLWIKLSIAIFCLALADFTGVVIRRFSDSRFAGLLKFWWLVLATAMIGGLVLIILFDMSPAQFRFHGANWFSRTFLGGTGHYEELPRSATDWIMRGHHQLGFQLFVAGFFLSAISLAWSGWRLGLRSAIPTTAYLLLLSAVFAWWVFLTQTSIPGIPQRAILVLVFVWLFRNLSVITATSPE